MERSSRLRKNYASLRDMRDERERRDWRSQSLRVVLASPVSLGLPVARETLAGFFSSLQLLGESVRQGADMHLELAPCCIIDITAQGILHYREGDLIPGNCSEGKQLHVEAFLTRPEIWRTHRPSEHQVGLPDVRETQNRKEADTLHLSLRFLQCLANGRLLNALADFHEACREGPEPGLGLDRTPAEENVAAPLRNTACDDLGIMVMNGLAGIADEPGQVVAGGNLLRNWGTAGAAIVHNDDVARKTYFVKRETNDASQTTMR
jgi:hypothetical protein